MALGHGYAAYKEVKVSTATQSNLLLMLFDGLITHLEAAAQALEAKSAEQSHQRLVKAQDIVDELMHSLNMDIEISHNLFALYSYSKERLVAANIAKDPAPVVEVLGLMKELRETWQEAARLQHNSQSTPVAQTGQEVSSEAAVAAGQTGPAGQAGQGRPISRLEITG